MRTCGFILLHDRLRQGLRKVVARRRAREPVDRCGAPRTSMVHPEILRLNHHFTRPPAEPSVMPAKGRLSANRGMNARACVRRGAQYRFATGREEAIRALASPLRTRVEPRRRAERARRAAAGRRGRGMAPDPMGAFRLWRREPPRTRTHTARIAGAGHAFDAAQASRGTGGLAIGCGSNVGAVAARIATTGARLDAFEPDRGAVAALEARLGHAPAASLHTAAVGTEAGRLALPTARERRPGSLEGAAFPALPAASPRIGPERIAEVELPERPYGTGKFAPTGRIVVETHEKQRPRLRARRLRRIHRAAALPPGTPDLDRG